MTFSKPSSNKDNLHQGRGFYEELLYIMGLRETQVNDEVLFERYPGGGRQPGSFLENTIAQLDDGKVDLLEKPNRYGKSPEERRFNVASELVATWMVRVIFLKFLEAWLLSCHYGDRAYEFLKLDKIKDYNDLNHLFFQVLSARPEEREGNIRQVFGNVPFLNPSLFPPSDLEQGTVFISDLTNAPLLPLYESTVLKPYPPGTPEGLGVLEYLFRVLDAYDFDLVGVDGGQSGDKAKVKPAIMDRLFRGIKGTDSKTFFVPGAIAADRNRETIRAAVVQKFNEEKGWDCVDLDSLNGKIVDRVEASGIINSLDASVFIGSSSHRMVLALNELVVIKNKLNIIQGPDGRWLKGYQMEAIGETLVVTRDNGKTLNYHPDDRESQLVQEALFYEKKTLIGNWVFQMDIDPRTVMICRLRGWLELLKSTYYKRSIADSANFSPVCYASEPGLRPQYMFSRELEPLPAIDI